MAKAKTKSKRFRKSNSGTSNTSKSKPNFKSSSKNKQYRKPTHVKRLENKANKPADPSVKNPFEVRINKVKHDVIGRGTRNEVGRPGISRAKAHEKRKGTLLEEYKHRNKSSMLIDNRIGEKNKNLPEEDKLIRRAAVEKTRQYKKKSIFSLRDDDEIFTHKGKTLTSIDRYDDPREQSDSEDELLSGAFVGDANFSGFLRMKTNEEDEDPEVNENGQIKKSRDEIIKELILASKKRKFEKAKESDENYEKIQNLDSEFKSPEFQTLLNQLQAPKRKKTFSFTDADADADGSVASSVDNLLAKIRSGYNKESEISSTSQEKEKASAEKSKIGTGTAIRTASAPAAEELDYDKLVRELQLEAKSARPTDLAKTLVQQAQDDREVLEKLLSETSGLSEILKSQIRESLDPVFLSKGEDKTKLPDILSSLIGFFLEQVDYGGSKTKQKRKEESAKLSILSPSFKAFCDIMLPHMHSLLVSNSVGCTKRFLEHLIQAREEFIKSNGRQISAQTVALLQVCPKLFLTSDSNHWVLNPAADFLLFAIHEATFNNALGAFRVLHLSSVLYDFAERSKRYCPEVVSFLWSILLCFCPQTPNNINLMIPNVRKARKCFVSSEQESDNQNQNTEEADDSDEDMESNKSKNKTITQSVDSVKQEYLSFTLDILQKYIILYEYLPSSIEIFKPIKSSLQEIQNAKEWDESIKSKLNSLVELISDLKGEKQFLRIATAKPKPLRLYEPQIDEDFDGTRRKKLPRKRQEEARLSHKVKQELKSAVREIKKDNLFLAREQLKEQLHLDADRKRKVKELMGSLANQEGDYQKMKRKK